MANGTPPVPGAIWYDPTGGGGEGAAGGAGYWVYPETNLTSGEPNALNVGAFPVPAAMQPGWNYTNVLQDQVAAMYNNPVSGYAGNKANYGSQLGRFQFSNTAPVSQSAPVGWGRYPGVGGGAPPPTWLKNYTSPPVPNPNPPQFPPPVTPPVTPPGTGTPPPTTGGPPPGGVYNPTGAWNGSGMSPASYNAHQATLAARRAPPAQPTVPNTTPINTSAVMNSMGLTNPNVWSTPTTRSNYSGEQVQWSPGDFADTGGNLSAWQQNWNALPPAMRVAYGQALAGGASGQLLRQIYEGEGASTASSANLVNSLKQGGVRYTVENGQLVQLSKSPNGTWTKTSMANLLNPNAPTSVRSL